MTPDRCEFRRQKAPQGNMCHYLCHMGTKCSCNVTPVVQKDANMVVRMSGSMIVALICCKKEKEGIEEAARNTTVYPKNCAG